MPSLALLHASQLITLAGPPRARRGKELGELAIIPDGALVAAGGKITPEERTYIWIRVFANEATRVEQYKMYQDPAFAKVGPPADAGFEKARLIIRANPTRFSKLQ